MADDACVVVTLGCVIRQHDYIRRLVTLDTKAVGIVGDANAPLLKHPPVAGHDDNLAAVADGSDEALQVALHPVRGGMQLHVVGATYHHFIPAPVRVVRATGETPQATPRRRAHPCLRPYGRSR